MERRTVAVARTSGKFKDAVDAAFQTARFYEKMQKSPTFRVRSTPQSTDTNSELKKFIKIFSRMADQREIYAFDLKLWVEPRTRKGKTNDSATKG